MPTPRSRMTSLPAALSGVRTASTSAVAWSPTSSLNGPPPPPSPNDIPSPGGHSPRQFYQINKLIESYTSRPAFPISLRQLVFFGRQTMRARERSNSNADRDRIGADNWLVEGKEMRGEEEKEDEERLIKGANFLLSELPIRISHRIRDIQSLPFIVGTHPSIEIVYAMYVQAFERFRSYPQVRTLEENERFCQWLSGMLRHHKIVIPQLAIGMAESPPPSLPASHLDAFLTRMLRSRIARRIMCHQHVALTRQFTRRPSGGDAPARYVGIVNTKVKPEEVVRRCARRLGMEVVSIGNGGGVTRARWDEAMGTGNEGAGAGRKDGKVRVMLEGSIGEGFAYVEDHLEYIIFELLKNSQRATIKKHGAGPELSNFPIRATVASNPRDVMIRISDQGGGIPATNMADPFPAFPVPPPTPSTSAASMYSSAARRDVFSFGSIRTRSPQGFSSQAPSPSTQMKSPPPDSTTFEDRGSPSSELSSPGPGSSTNARPNNPKLQAWKSIGELEGTVREQIDRGNVSFGKEIPLEEKEAMGDDIGQQTGGEGPSGGFKGAKMLGVGLPLSRMYAEFFGGSLELYSSDGYGADAYISVPKVGYQREAVL